MLFQELELAEIFGFRQEVSQNDKALVLEDHTMRPKPA